jgi:hypothetical protein
MCDEYEEEERVIDYRSFVEAVDLLREEIHRLRYELCKIWKQHKDQDQA